MVRSDLETPSFYGLPSLFTITLCFLEHSENTWIFLTNQKEEISSEITAVHSPPTH